MSLLAQGFLRLVTAMHAIGGLVFFLSSLLTPAILPCRASDSIQQLHVEQIRSLDEMRAALGLLKKSTARALEKKEGTYGLQKLILEKSGACISQLVSFQNNSPQGTSPGGQEVKDLFLQNRDVIKEILASNEMITRDLQENRLDRMKDPLAFFQSTAWQHPQHLISLSSYWLGWNGYYSSLVFSRDEPVRRELLEEAIEGFSRSFLDFDQDDIKNRSLLGRGLCYRQLKNHKYAVRDFASVKSKTKEGDRLHARCLYEEAQISYETGNMGSALNRLDQVEEASWGQENLHALMLGARKLRARILIARTEKKGEASGTSAEDLERVRRKAFHELKRMAESHSGLSAEFYRYAHEHAESLKHLSPAELGPVGSLAMGDWYFQKKAYDRAGDYYQALPEDSRLIPENRRDGVCYRTAYIHSKRKQWRRAVRLLEGFGMRFPSSSLQKEAASLYYVAATNDYKEDSNPGTYSQFVDSIRTYLTRCSTCPDQGEAHFQLAAYYKKSGDSTEALKAFLQVDEDSPRFPMAAYHALECYLETLDALRKDGQGQSRAAREIYQEAVRHLARLDDRNGLHEKVTGKRKELEPYLVLARAGLHLFGPADARRTALKQMEGFERRFPGEQKLFLKAAILRLEYSLSLSMPGSAEKEIRSLLLGPSMDQERFEDLLEIANRFYRKAMRMQDNGNTGASAPPAEAALILYENLHQVSRKDPSCKRYGQSIRLRMGQIYMCRDNLARALKLYQDVLAHDPASADAVYHLGLIYERTAQWEEALRAWRKVTDGVKAGTVHWFESRYHTALCLQKLGKTNKACTIIRMTSVLHPDLGDPELSERFLGLKTKICETE